MSDSGTAWHNRRKHFTWAQFTSPLSTSGIGVLLAAQPHLFPDLQTIGKIFFLFALTLFILGIFAIASRFITWPGTLRSSLAHPTEALFLPVFFITIANLLGCSQLYGAPDCGPWLTTAMRVCFWVYVAVAFSLAVLQYLSLFNAHPSRLTVQSMTPAWILPIFPIMISGTLAQIIAPGQPPAARLAIIIAGISFQGLGWMVAFIMYAAYLHRLMEFGLPAPNLRPGMFISVGPPGFTCVALIGLSCALPEDHGYFASHPAAIETLQTVALFASMFLWMLAFWFFCVSACAVLLGVREMSFHLIW